MLGMNDELQRQMETYVKFIRPQFAQPGEEHLFIKDDGYGFKEATIGKRVTAFFAKTGISDRRFTHTGLRKCFSSNLEEMAEPEEVDDVEKVMSHGKTTRKRSYVRRQCTKIASKAMATIAKITTASKPEPEEQATPQEDNDCVEDEGGEDDELGADVAAAQDEEEENIIPPSPPAAAAVPSTSASHPPSIKSGPVPVSPSRLTEEEKTLIRAHLAEELQIGQPLRLGQVRTKLFKNKKLVKFATFAVQTTKVQKHLNYLMGLTPARKPPTTPPKKVTEKVDHWLEGLEDEAPSTSSRQSDKSRSWWSDEQTTIIERHFAKFDRVPTKSTIKSEFLSYDALKDIMKEEGFTRCYEKVKSTFKKRAAKK